MLTYMLMKINSIFLNKNKLSEKSNTVFIFINLFNI